MLIPSSRSTRTKTKVDEVKSSMDELYKALIEMRVIPKMKIVEGNYSYCHEVSLNHIIGECDKFKALLQRMMDQGEIEFFKRIMERSINVIIDAKFIGESFEGRPRPLMIFFEDNPILVANVNVHPSKLIVKVSSPFLYTDSKMVPWSYHCNYVNEPTTANISGIGSMTRNRRCYALVAVETIPLNPIKELSSQKSLK